MKLLLNIDRLDAQILGLLSRDSRTGMVQLATTLGVSRNTVQARIRRLEDAGVIAGYRVELDLATAGFATQAFTALKIEQGTLPAVVDSLAEIPQVLMVHPTTGHGDLLVQVATKTQAELQGLVQRIVAIPGGMHSNTIFALTTPLHYRATPLLEEMTREAGWGRSTPDPHL